MAQDKGISLEFKAPSHPVFVLANAARLQRVIANLLDNALKFTDEKGSVCLEIKDDQNDVIISVKDTGIGIHSSDQARIFEKFYRVESSRSTPGHGLGLSYVKSMVLSMGGVLASIVPLDMVLLLSLRLQKCNLPVIFLSFLPFILNLRSQSKHFLPIVSKVI